MKPIFENEKECREYLRSVWGKFNDMVSQSHEKGYIKKSELEQSKENYYKSREEGSIIKTETYYYITELESEIERLKNDS
jgi:hypothetical protein